VRGVVYFVQADGLDLIKIGYAVDFAKRLADLCNMNACGLRTLGVVLSDDCTQLERVLHKRFRDYRHHSEWFHANDEIRSYIKDHTIQPHEMVEPFVEWSPDGESLDEALPEMMSIRELATYFKVTPGTIRRHIKDNYITTVRVGKQIRANPKDIIQAGCAVAIRERLTAYDGYIRTRKIRDAHQANS
jgi:excisionase family DNA binding protein